MIVKAGTIIHKNALPVGQWSHVAATFDSKTGKQCLYINGKLAVDDESNNARKGNEGEIISQGYALQRFITACAGRGTYPIKFNGTLFTVDFEGDPDYRRWGPEYWLQNTRLMYWPRSPEIWCITKLVWLGR